MVTCAKCGEELLGSVNRCWKCGTEFAKHADQYGLPPVRRPSIAGIANQAETESQSNASGNETSVAQLNRGVSSVPARRGSPFDNGATWKTLAFDGVEKGGGAIVNPVPAVAGVSAIFVAVFSYFVTQQVPLAGMVLAAFAIVLAIIALLGQRRWIAIFGIVAGLSCFSLAGYEFAIQLYIHLHGVSPWVKEAPLENEFETGETE